MAVAAELVEKVEMLLVVEAAVVGYQVRVRDVAADFDLS